MCWYVPCLPFSLPPPSLLGRPAEEEEERREKEEEFVFLFFFLLLDSPSRAQHNKKIEKQRGQKGRRGGPLPWGKIKHFSHDLSMSWCFLFFFFVGAQSLRKAEEMVIFAPHTWYLHGFYTSHSVPTPAFYIATNKLPSSQVSVSHTHTSLSHRRVKPL